MSTDRYVRAEERDTRFYIWKQRKYLCKMKYIHTRDVEDLRDFGMPTSGMPEYDSEMANEVVERVLTIAEMEDYFHRGIDVSIIDRKQTKEIYERISDHLVAWKNYINTSMNLKDPDVEGLVRLDTFAAAVYYHAKRHFTVGAVDSIMARLVGSRSQSYESIMAARGNANTSNATSNDKPVEEKKYPERDSLAKTFIGFRPTGNMKWK